MGYNGRLSLKILEKSVKVQNLPYPLLRGQPLKIVLRSICLICFGPFSVLVSDVKATLKRFLHIHFSEFKLFPICIEL